MTNKAHTAFHRSIARYKALATVMVGIGFLLSLLVFFSEDFGLAKLDQLGNIGSYFSGAIASLWGLAATILIYVTFLLQHESLLVQQKQLEQSDRIHEQTRKDTISKNMENMFGQLLMQWNSTMTAYVGPTSYGKRYVSEMSTELRNRLGEVPAAPDVEKAFDELQIIGKFLNLPRLMGSILEYAQHASHDENRIRFFRQQLLGHITPEEVYLLRLFTMHPNVHLPNRERLLEFLNQYE